MKFILVGYASAIGAEQAKALLAAKIWALCDLGGVSYAVLGPGGWIVCFYFENDFAARDRFWP